MTEWIIAITCLTIVIASILVTSIVKLCMKRAVENKGGEFNCKKWEYLYAAISLVLTVAGVFLFLRFGAKITDVNRLIKTTCLYAGSVQTIYLFIVQLCRKGFKGIFEYLGSLVADLKESDNPVEELPEKIEQEVNTDPDVAKLEKDLDKIIKK